MHAYDKLYVFSASTMYTATRSEPLDSITMPYLEFIYSLLTAAEANVRFKGLEIEFSSHIQ